jgi:large subunit ribosomal protein L13
MKTYQPKEKDIERKWHLINAQGEIVGRLSSKVAALLMGKGKTNFSKHMDSGDFVVVTNVEKIVFTGKKEKQKLYRTHSGYPAGFKERTAEKIRTEHPERILEHAIKGMLPENRLKKDRMARLKLVVNAENPFADKFKIKEK